MLDDVNQLFIERDVLVRSITKFEDIFNEGSYKDFVSWKLLTGTRSRSLHITDKDKKNVVVEKIRD